MAEEKVEKKTKSTENTVKETEKKDSSKIGKKSTTKKSTGGAKIGGKPAVKNPVKFKKEEKDSKKLNFKHSDDTDDEKIYYCTACGKGYPAKLQIKNFPFSHSPFYKNNNKRLAICNECFDSSVEQYTELLGSNDDAIKRVCLHFDMYFDEGVLKSSRNVNKQNSRIKHYIRLLNLSQNNGKTYDNYLEEKAFKGAIVAEEQIKSLAESSDDEDEREKKKKELEKSTKEWGYGFSIEDYNYLNYKYEELKTANVIDDSMKEKYVRDISMMCLLQNRALIDDDIELYQKMTKTLQDTLRNANLTPRQQEQFARDIEKPLGVMIDEFENKRPIPEPLDEWKDVDGIMKLILVYFIGHLSKMIGLKNRYSAMYEAEMEKYRPQLDDPDGAESEDIFEYLLDNDFEGVSLSSNDGESDDIDDEIDKLIPSIPNNSDDESFEDGDL